MTASPGLAAKQEIRRLYEGGAPNGHQPAEFGNEAYLVQMAHEAWQRGRTKEVREVLDKAARLDKSGWLRSALIRQATVHVPGMPPLPDAAQAVYQHLAPCGQWLDDYVAFAREIVPTMVESFHEVAALFLVSIAVARRAVLRFRGGDLFPNIYALFVAPSGYGKSTAFNAMQRVLQAADLRHLLLTDQMSPENLITQLSTSVPKTLETWPADVQQEWIKEKAFAGQRGWAVDEASFLFESFSREYMNGMMGHLLRLYDCPATPPSRETQSGGRILLKDVSLSFFGASTPINMRPHLQNTTWWENGLWGRFTLIVPDREAVWVDDESNGEYIPIPSPLVQHLRTIHTMFGTPSAHLDEDDKKRPFVTILGQTDPYPVRLAPGVYQAWQTYRKATSHDIGKSKQIDEALEGSYSRFATQAIKVAMLLAIMDAGGPQIIVQLHHYATAQQMVERWRAMTHQIWIAEMKIDEQRLADKVIAKLRQYKPDGLTARQLQQQLNKASKEIHDVLSLLQEAGQIQSTKQGQKTLWQVMV